MHRVNSVLFRKSRLSHTFSLRFVKSIFSITGILTPIATGIGMDCYHTARTAATLSRPVTNADIWYVYDNSSVAV
jgi:hypothetical protein